MVGPKILKILSNPLEVSVLHIHAALESYGQQSDFPQYLVHRFCKAARCIQEHTYAMEWIYKLVLHASNVMSAIIAETSIIASILLTRLAGRYYDIHRVLCFIETHARFRWCATKSPYYYHIH